MALGLTAAVVGVRPADAATATVGLGKAGSFAVLAGSTVTNTGPSLIRGDLGVSPGSAVTGFPPGVVSPGGTIHAADSQAIDAQTDLTTAYLDAAGRTPTAPPIVAPLGGGQVLVRGVYQGTTLDLGGTLTLDGEGDPGAVFIFQSASTLITASASVVALTNGAQACNVFWQVGSSATLGTTSTFVGTILALTSVSATTGAVVQGRLLARNGAVTLDTNTVRVPRCAALPSPTTTTTVGPTTTTTVGPTTTTTVGPTTTSTTSALPTPSGTGGGGSPPSAGGAGITGGAPSAGGGTSRADGKARSRSGAGSRSDGRGSGGGTATSGRPGLPNTGAHVTLLTGTGLGLLVLGAAMVLSSRRRLC